VPQVASALDHAHEHGLLHLNLKPSNILLDHPGNAFVADFGLPAPIDSPYAAPEIARGGLIDARADVYALGAVLYELVTGHAPAARRPRAESANQRMAELPAPRSIRAGIAPAFEAMIMRALSIDPESRYATPGDLARAFAEAAEVAASQPREARPMRVPALGWIGAGIAGIVLLIGALVVSSGANAPAAVPSLAPPTTIAATATKPAARTETPSPEPTPTRARTATPAPSTASPTVQSTTAVPSTTARSTLPVAQTVTVTAIRPSATAAFRVISLDLKPPANRDAPGERLDLLFDAVIEPSTGGPFGQLFAYLPDIDSYVTSRIGAQVSSGTQVLHVTLVVNCAELPAPFTTQRLFLEIRPNDRGPALYAQTIDYMKIWCR
jgi:serine/threonine protein kinase